METVFIQIPADLFGKIYAQYKDETADTINNCLGRLLDARRSEYSVSERDRPQHQFAQRPTGVKTGKVWEIADRLESAGNADRASVVKTCVEEEQINPNTANTQYSHWKKSRSVMAYQDFTLMDNDREGAQFTDAALVELWHKKFPNALYLNKQNTFGEYRYVRDIRRCFNQGAEGHGERDDQGTIVGQPLRLSLPYNDSKKTYAYSDRWLKSCEKSGPRE
jgi:hypothetical protein